MPRLRPESDRCYDDARLVEAWSTTRPQFESTDWQHQFVQSTRDVEVRRRVGQARVARLATVDGHGRPHVVPICFALADDVLYSAVDSKPKRSPRLKRLENIRANPNVTVLVDHYEDDWSRLWWVRLRGRGRVLEGGEERDRALALLADKYQQYRAEPPVDAVIAIDLDEWREWCAQAGGGLIEEMR